MNSGAARRRRSRFQASAWSYPYVVTVVPVRLLRASDLGADQRAVGNQPGAWNDCATEDGGACGPGCGGTVLAAPRLGQLRLNFWLAWPLQS
jgi:hypothetical protein